MTRLTRFSKRFGYHRLSSRLREATSIHSYDALFRTFAITASILCLGSVHILLNHDEDDDVNGQSSEVASVSTTSFRFRNILNHLILSKDIFNNPTSTAKALSIHPMLYTQCDGVYPVVDKTINCNNSNRIIFIGSGSSTGCPRPLCPLLFSDLVNTKEVSIHDHDNNNNDTTLTPELEKLRETMFDQCRTSILASRGDPIQNKDYRNNPSLLISVVAEASSPDPNAMNSPPLQQQRYNILIDVGKTFREGAIRWLPKYHIPSIDAIVLTHQHMDAAGGLDDVRGFQKYQFIPSDNDDNDKNTTDGEATRKIKRQPIPMPVYLSDFCLGCLQDQFPWLLPKSQPKTQIDPNTPPRPFVPRHTASFDVNIFESFQSFEPVPGFKITPLPLIHGEDLISYGFAFSLGPNMNVVYLSDISRMLPETLDYIQNTLPQPTHVLILDALLIDSTNPVHYCLPQSLELVQQLQPIQTYLVGMNCDSFGPHEERNEQLRKDHGKVQLAHDGLVIDASPVDELKSED